jgi:hypothetical protein
MTVRRTRGNATVEVIVALLALSPLLIGIPVLGKQLDIKHKAYEASRYSVWERTVWSNTGSTHRKADSEISLESLDRSLGDPRSGLISAQAIRQLGVGENSLWRDASNQRMILRGAGAPLDLAMAEHRAPAGVGHELASGVAHGGGILEPAAEALQLHHLDLERRGFVTADLSIALRPILPLASQRVPSLARAADKHDESEPLVQRATAAILSNTWSAETESTLRQRIDEVTTNELIGDLERPGRFLGLQAVGKGQPLYGEGQFGWDPDFRPTSNMVPASYLRRR